MRRSEHPLPVRLRALLVTAVLGIGALAGAILSATGCCVLVLASGSAKARPQPASPPAA